MPFWMDLERHPELVGEVLDEGLDRIRGGKVGELLAGGHETKLLLIVTETI